MHLTLFVPDLLWPEVDDAAAFDFPGAADLARFLFLSDASRSEMTPSASWESRLAMLFGFTEAHAPLAALRAVGSGLPAVGTQLCTDPVNLDFMQQALVLSPIARDTLTDTDRHALLQSLNEEFAEEGHFIAMPHHAEAGSACQWTFKPATAASDLPNLAACSRLAGRRVDADETRQLLGRDGLRWINRIQMCLNPHPVNQAREAQGLPTINSLWPWGLGELTAAPSHRFTTAQGHAALLNGLCQITGTLLTPPAVWPQTAGQHLITELHLTDAICHSDLTAWQAAISEMVTQWIAPALAALVDRKRPLQSLTLISPGAQHEHRWTLHRSSAKGCGNFLQRCLGLAPKVPTLHTLVRSWSV